MRTATVYNFLLEANLMAGAAILLMLMIRKFFRKQLGNRAILFAWLLVALRLLCPLALPNPVMNEIRPFYSSDLAIRPIAGQIQIRFTDALDKAIQPAWQNNMEDEPAYRLLDSVREDAYDGRLSQRLMTVYGAGALLVLCWFTLSNLRFRRRLKADRIGPVSGKLLEQYEALCKKRKVKQLPVWYVDPLPSACLVGVIRPYIALPLSAAPQEAIQVLTHEVCHYQGHDQLWGVLRLACCVIHWFNPLVWLAANLSRTDTELACDDRVTVAMDTEQRKAYASVLVLAAAKRDAPGVAVLATGMTMTGRKLKNRISAILHSGQIKKWFAAGFAVLACFLLVGAFATGEYRPLAAIPALRERAPLSIRQVNSTEDAIAYAQEIGLSGAVQWSMEDVTWSAELDADGFYVVTATSTDAADSEAENKFTVSFLPSGQIKNLEDVGIVRSFPDNSPHPKIDKALRQSITEYLNDFVLQLQPEYTAKRIDGLYSVTNQGRELQWYVAADSLNNGLAYFCVEVYPEVKIVQYTNYTYNND